LSPKVVLFHFHRSFVLIYTTVDNLVGDMLKKGDPILIIEAMKMEHVIRAPTAGTVGSIACKAGDLVCRCSCCVRARVGFSDLHYLGR
jgi:acetyl/propionyl-CoA carboxylase alpha subunit